MKNVFFPYFHYFSKSAAELSHTAELAALISFAETGRKRKGLFSGVDEHLRYISLFLYPFYAYPWRNKLILLKPFSFSGVTIRYSETIDFHKFFGNLGSTSIALKAYTEFLEESTPLFKSYPKVKDLKLGDFVSDKDLTLKLVNESNKQPVTEKTVEGLIPGSMKLDFEKQRIDVEILRKNMQIDIDNLSATTEVLDAELDKHTSKIELELNLVEESADKEIEESLPSIRKTVKKIEKERNKVIRQTETEFRRELSTLSGKKTKLENELRRLRQQEARFEREKEKKKRRGDNLSARFWGKELTKCRREISRLKSELSRNMKKMDKFKSQFDEKIEGVKKHYTKAILDERQKIIDIENRRDSYIQGLKEDIAILEDYTAIITKDIARLAETKKCEIETLEDIAAPIKIEEEMVICVPFYLTRYSSRNTVRYEIIAPAMIDTSRKALSVVKRRLVGLDGRLSNMLKPYSSELSNLIGSDLTSKLSNDAAFTAEIDSCAAKLNILFKEGFSEILENGFNELVNRGFLSRTEATKIKSQKGYWR